MWSKIRVDSKKIFFRECPPPLYLRAWMNAPHVIWRSGSATVQYLKRGKPDSNSCMIVFRVCYCNKTNCHDICAEKMKGLSQPLKDLALMDQTDFSRFLWSASLVSRVEVWRGLSNTHHHLKWRNQGRSGAPIIFRPNWGPNGRKKFFRGRPHLHLRDWMTANLPLIWRSESATDVYLLQSYFYDLNKLRNKWWVLDMRRRFGRTGRSKRAEIGTGDNSP